MTPKRQVHRERHRAATSPVACFLVSASLGGASPPAVRGTEDVTAPIHVRGSISFPTGTVSNVRATNATADGSSFAFDDQLGGGGPVTTRIAVSLRFIDQSRIDMLSVLTF